MNRRDILKSLAALFALPAKNVFGYFSKPKVKWPDGYDFDFEGTPCKFYIWPRDRQIVFTDPKHYMTNDVMIPIFDLREFSNVPLEQQMREAIKYNLENHLNEPPFLCSIVKYEGCDSCFGILCSGMGYRPKTSFTFDAVLHRQSRLSERLGGDREVEGRWGEPVTIKKLTQEEIDRQVNEYADNLNSNNHIVDKANKFLKTITG